jgi:hypothetical protein
MLFSIHPENKAITAKYLSLLYSCNLSSSIQPIAAAALCIFDFQLPVEAAELALSLVNSQSILWHSISSHVHFFALQLSAWALRRSFF